LGESGSQNVIDNNKILLRDVLLQTLPNVESASFALGYFFISGFAVIIEPVKKLKKLRLLISPTTDSPTAEALKQGFKTVQQVNKELSKQQFVNTKKLDEIKNSTNENITKSLELMEQSNDDQNVVTQLVQMMKDKKVEVRIYKKEKLHAKAYLFDLSKDSQQMMGSKGIGIVGSSNLSLAGMEHSSELNLRTVHPADYENLKEWFEELWKDGLKYTEDFKIILEKSWAGKTYTPHELYLKAAYHEVKDKIEGEHAIDPIWGTTFPKLFPFQRNAVDHGLTMFEQYGGVIIGDVVGLGKTYVGTAILKYLQLQEYRPLIVCPPQLEAMWEKFCSDYEVDAKILSRGMLSQSDYELFQDFRYKDRDLVLIDESHHFRNSDSRQYENLKTFMDARDAKAILLTATPFSNRPDDIKNQVMLFHSSPETNIPPANETDLVKYFKKIKKGDSDVNLVDFLRNIMIRRTRRYVLKQWGKTDEKNPDWKYVLVEGERKYFPNRKLSTITYKIDKVYQKKYESIVKKLHKGKLTFARYSPGIYLKEEYQEKDPYRDLKTTGPKLVALVRHSLLKRMESSLFAFQKSIDVYINTHKIFLNLLEKGTLPIGDLSSKEMYQTAMNDPDFIDDPEKLEQMAKKIQESGETKYKIEAFQIEKLAEDIQADLEVFEEIGGLIQRLTYKTDDKLITLQNLLDTKYRGKKVLIFTEFTTTAKYLNTYLKWRGKKRQVDSSTGDNMVAVRQFDPENNPGSYGTIKKEDQISLLISTDVLSEGINLQAGEAVINYDFHWNPVRLIQRAGRVDRIGSKHETITVENFLPDPKIEKDLRLEEKVDHKIDEIQKVIGEDYHILKITETINEDDIYAIYRGEESVLDKEENPLEPSRFEQILTDLQVNNPEFWKEFKKIPDGIRSCANDDKEGNLIMACESGTIKSGKIRKYYMINSKKEIKEMLSGEVLNLLEQVNENQLAGLPSKYNELLSLGWNKFLEDVEQVHAKEKANPSLSTAQRWVTKKLLEISELEEFKEEYDTIDTLRTAFLMPIFRGRLNRELLKIKKANLNNSEILKSLSELYLNFELQKEVETEEKEADSPRILYSAFIGKND